MNRWTEQSSKRRRKRGVVKWSKRKLRLRRRRWRRKDGSVGSGDTYGRCGRRCCSTSSPFSFSPPVFSSPEPSFHTTVNAPTCHSPLASLPTTDLAGPNPQLTVSSSSFSMLSGTLPCVDDVHNYHHSLMALCSVICVSGLISLLPVPSSQVTYLTYSSLAKRFFFFFFSQVCYVVWQSRNRGWINCQFWRMRRRRDRCPQGFSKPLLIRLPLVCSAWRSNQFLFHEFNVLR